MHAPSPNDTPDGDRPTLEGLGPRGRAGGLEPKSLYSPPVTKTSERARRGGLEANAAIAAAGDEDAVEGRADEGSKPTSL